MRDAGLTTVPGSVERMTIKTYVAVLHEGFVPTSAGEPVVCSLQPDGLPEERPGSPRCDLSPDGTADICRIL
jgi:hypothetical protein